MLSLASWLRHAATAILLAAAPPSEVESVRAIIVAQPVTAGGELTLLVRLDTRQLRLGAYQGIVRYAPRTLAILSTTSPGDGIRLTNAADSLNGIIRFAGFSTSGFKTLDVMQVIVRPLQKLETARLSVELTAATDLQGIAVPDDSLFSTRGFQPDTARRYPGMNHDSF